MLLEELSLLDQIKAISVFHPVKSKKISKIAGGIFLTKRAFDSKKKKIIFFDESIEVRRTLKNIENAEILEVFTRKIGAFEAYKVSKEILSSFTKNCEARIKEIDKRVKKIRLGLSQKKFLKTYLFYLGKFEKNKKDPELLIVNDGFVKDLIQHSNIKTYPSPLEYVTWSTKILKTISKNAIKLSISDGKLDNIEKKEIEPLKYSLFYRGALSPGIRQVYFLEEFITKFF